MEKDYHKEIEKLIRENRVFVFMKGEPDRPACRFSAQVSDILRRMGVIYGYFNVLEDDGIREAIKKYSDWPTIPQIFVEGKFIGGADILTELDESGELKAILG
jgi:monothiol glutaredoxin